MKFYYYFSTFIFYSLSCLAADDDNFYADHFSHTLSDRMPNQSTFEFKLPHDLKLIKTNFGKFAQNQFFTYYRKAEILTTDQQNSIVENTVSTEIQNILWHVKSYLEKTENETQIFTGTNFSQIINQSLVRLLTLTPMFLASNMQEEASMLEIDSKESSQNEELPLKLNILLDRYFRSQLLVFNYALLLPISSQNIDRYNTTSSAIKLKFFRLIGDKLKFDDLKSWSQKKQMFFILDQAVRHLSNPLTLEDLSELTLRGLNYTINQEYLLDYYRESCSFLISIYIQNLEGIKAFSELKDLSFTYLSEFLSLYNDYSKIFPDLFKSKETENFLLGQLKQQLNKLYEFHMNMSNQYFREEALKCTDLDKFSHLLKYYILETQKFNAKFTSSYTQLFSPDLSIRFQEAIISYFEDTLYCLEHHFEANRLMLSKTLTSLGWKKSQTKDFLTQLESLYKTVFPFLFDESTKTGKTFISKIAHLKEKINMDEQASLDKTLETIEAVKSYINPYKWLNKDQPK